MTNTEQDPARLCSELLNAPVTSGDASFWKLGGHSVLGRHSLVGVQPGRGGNALPIRYERRLPR